jgi:hypothetical protein
VLARQMRNFRGDLSQAEFGAQLGKRQTIISRLESPAYGSWTLRTMFEIARKKNLAVFARFVDFPTFLKYTNDLSDDALNPQPYEPEIDIDYETHTVNKPLDQRWQTITTSQHEDQIEVTTSSVLFATEKVAANDNSTYYQVTKQQSNVR